MKERKIVKGLEKLTGHELNNFHKFLLSPYFNQNEYSLALFNLYFDAIKNERDLNTITNQEMWTHIFGNTEYNDLRLRRVASDLFGLFEEFMIQKELEQDNTQKLNLLLRAYKSREYKDLYGSAVQSIETVEKTQHNKNADYYLQKYVGEKAMLEFNIKGYIPRNLNLEEKLNIEEVSINLDVFFIAEKLKYYCNYLSWSRSYKLDKKIVGIEIILKLAQSPIFKDYPPISVYYTISKTITDESNTEHFYKLKELIKKYLHLFSQEEAKEIFESALNYSITRGNKGNPEFEKESFELYKQGLQLEILLNKGVLSPGNFRNIVFYALRSNDYEWAEEFINDYSKNLEPSIRQSNINFGNARIAIYKKDFKKVIEKLVFTEYTEVFQALLSRTLILLSYYELNEIEPIESLFSSFKLYLDREKTLQKERKTQYYNLIRFTKLLIKIGPKEKTKLQKLKADIEQTDPIVNKQWLLEKVGEKMG